MIQFFNTLSGEVEPFKPMKKGEVSIYTCGPTVYDYAHIGNFRAFVFEDLLRRFLEFEGLKVNHVMNLTDVDDKTIAGAAKKGSDLNDFTAEYIQAFNDDLKTLNILLPTKQPRATEEMQGMIDLVSQLEKKGFAYESEGSVYYRVSEFKDYGKLSKKKLDKNIQGARVDVDEYDKEEGADFVLWKKSKEGEPAWDSPWGKGRPGWHLECSAMSMRHLGPTFDMHAGGEDLVFPHHENEIAQSEAATGKKFVHYWVHCKFLLVDGEKMSKSKGNFYTLRDLLAKGKDPAAIRCALISTHYRTPLNFTFDSLKKAEDLIKKLDDCYFQCLTNHQRYPNNSDERTPLSSALENATKEIVCALENDLNVSIALAKVLESVSEINRAIADRSNLSAVAETGLNFFKNMDKLFGFSVTADVIPDPVLTSLMKREEVRCDTNFKKDKNLQQESDRLRDEIKENGWLLKDSRPGEPSTIKKRRRAWD